MTAIIKAQMITEAQWKILIQLVREGIWKEMRIAFKLSFKARAEILTGVNVNREGKPGNEKSESKILDTEKHICQGEQQYLLECSSMQEEGNYRLKGRWGLKCHPKESRMYSTENWGATKRVPPAELIMTSTVLRKIILSAVHGIKLTEERNRRQGEQDTSDCRSLRERLKGS